jgi:hypothetical protein
MAKSFRETPEIAAATARMVRAIGRRVGQEDPNSLTSLMVVQIAIDDAWRNAVNDLRDAEFPDWQIAEMLGITRQAVQQRWPR